MDTADFFADEKARQKIIFGDIERPTEFDKFIVQESDDTNVCVRSQLAYLARESAYIGRHLERLAEEKIDGEIAEWYKRAERPFTYRLVPIQALYEDVEDILSRRLPNLREDFKASYEKMLAVAQKCNIERAKWFWALPVKPIEEFKSAAAEFHKIIYAIHTEALIEMNKLTQPASSGKNEATELPVETEQNTNATKEGKGDVNVNIFGPFQAGNLQIAQDASIHEQSVIEEKKKDSLKRLLKIIITCLGYLLGWLEPIKAFISKILWPK